MKIYKNFYLHKNTLLIRELNNGIVSKVKFPIKPSYYYVTDKDSEHKSIYGHNLIKMDFENQYEAKDWLEMYKTQKHKIFGFPHYEYCKIHELFPGDLSKVFNIKDFNVCVLDIETKAEGRIYPITYMLTIKDPNTEEIKKVSVKQFEKQYPYTTLVLESNDWVEYKKSIYFPPGKWPDHELANEEINLISLSISGPNNPNKNVNTFIKTFGTKDLELDTEDSKDTEYVYCEDETELLKLFVEYWMTLDMDICSGWNSNSFDIAYLIKRITQTLGEEYAKNLSPWKIINSKKTKNDYGKEITLFEIAGISLFDYLELYKKFSPNESESYKLDYIALTELNDKKVEYDCSFRELYTDYYELFTKYNIHDVRLVTKLEKKLGYIALACTMLYRAKVTAPDVFTTVRIWDVIITNYTKDMNMYVPTYLSDNSSAGTYGGGYVKDPLVGFYLWLLSIDATSLYPSIERTLNTSPETILPSDNFIRITPDDILNNTKVYRSAVENAKRLNASLAANGALFSNEKQGIIPALNEKYFNERVIEKGLGKQYEKSAAKIAQILKERGIQV